MTAFLNYKIIDLEYYHLTVFRLLLVGVILVLTYLCMRLLKRWAARMHKEKKIDKGRKQSIYQILKYFIWVISLIICLQLIGVQITVLIAGSAALLVGLGIGIQQIFNDLVSGMFLLFEGSVEVDDILEVDGMVCVVKKINLRTSEVITRDDVIKIVPNHKFITETVTNWSKQKQPEARFRTTIGVSYNSDPGKIKEILLSVLQNHPEIVAKNAYSPMVRFVDFADSSINFELVFHTENIFRVDNLLSDIRYETFELFKKNNIEIPYPQQDLHIKTSDLKLVKE